MQQTTQWLNTVTQMAQLPSAQRSGFLVDGIIQELNEIAPTNAQVQHLVQQLQATRPQIVKGLNNVT